MFASTVLHLLVSQSIFLVHTQVYSHTGGDYTPFSNMTPILTEEGSFVAAGANCPGILACKSH